MSPPLLYYHFASRSGLIRAALEHASEQAPSTALRREPTGKDGFEAVQTALLAELDDDRAVRENAVVWGEVSASAVFEPALREDVRRVSEEWCATVAAGIQRGCRRRLDPPRRGSRRGGADPDHAGGRPLHPLACRGDRPRAGSRAPSRRDRANAAASAGAVSSPYLFGAADLPRSPPREIQVDMRGTRLWLVIAMIIGLLASAIVAGCGDDDDDSSGGSDESADLGLIQDGTLMVASDIPYPPFEQGDPAGLRGLRHRSDQRRRR